MNGFAELKALLTAHGIKVYMVDGEPKIDKEGLIRAIEAGILPEDPADLKDHFGRMFGR